MPDGAYDVVIAGGGVIGSSIAFFLSENPRDPGLRIAVVEPDPTYATSSTALSVGGIRQQFSTPENILLSRFTIEFLGEAPHRLAVDGEAPSLGFVEAGYLFLASPEGEAALSANHAVQRELGVECALLPPLELQGRFPWLHVADLAGGSLGLKGEGWMDPYSLLRAFRRKAASRGVTFLEDRVVGLETGGGRVQGATLGSGARLDLGTLVNAAGPRAAEVASMAGLRLPVRPRKRFVYQVRCREALPGSPLTIDPTGVYFRPEGPDFLCGVSPPPQEDPDTLDLEMDYRLFEEVVWPTLARRVPVFESLRLGSSWAGHYAVNTRDRNAILGPHPEMENFLFANGFSGHGLQHAPGIGRALSELILFGEYRTLDLHRFRFHRLLTDDLVQERNVV